MFHQTQITSSDMCETNGNIEFKNFGKESNSDPENS